MYLTFIFSCINFRKTVTIVTIYHFLLFIVVTVTYTFLKHFYELIFDNNGYIYFIVYYVLCITPKSTQNRFIKRNGYIIAFIINTFTTNIFLKIENFHFK